MPRTLRTHLALTTAITLITAPAAWADVSAADVWQNMNAPLAAMGMTTSATPQQTADGSLYQSPTYDFTLPMGIGGGSLTMPSMLLAENGDGTVTVSYAEPMEFIFSGFISGEGSVAATVQMQADRSDMLATGTPGDVTYAANTGGVSLTLSELLIDNAAMNDIEFSMQVQGTGTVVQHIIEGDLVQMSLETEAAAGTSQIRIVGPDGTTTLIDATTEGGVLDMDLALPAGGSDLLNLAPAFAQGLAISFASTNGGQVQNQTVTSDLGVLISSQSTTAGASSAVMGLSQDGLVADATLDSMEANIQDQALPFPVSFSAQETRIGYIVPLSAADDPQDFGFLLSMADLAVSDNLWDLLDPARGLDRTPGDMVIDFSGSAVLNNDVTNFMEFGMAVDRGEMVAELNALDINAIELGALGAVAQASGAFTFDNTDMVTYPGMPKPVGAFSFTIDGLNSAMDQLVSVGLLSPDDIFGARMMIGLVAQANGNDGLVGNIELGEDGSITANGQRLR